MSVFGIHTGLYSLILLEVQHLTHTHKQTPTCDAAQLLISQVLVAELIVLCLVHECDVMGLQVSF